MPVGAPPLSLAIEFAGHLAADALTRITESGARCTVLAHPAASGQASIRILGDDASERQAADTQLDSLAAAHGCAALLFERNRISDRRIAWELVIELALPAERMRIVIPFRNGEAPEGFGVASPQFSTLASSRHDLRKLAEDFFRGIDAYPGGRTLWNNHHLASDGRKTVESVDLGDLALSVAVRSFAYFVLAAIAGVVVIVLVSLAGPKSLSRMSAWPLIWTFWAILQLEILLRLRRLAKAAPPYRATSRAIHQLEFCSAGFLLLYALARPHLIDSDASAFPHVENLFRFIVGGAALSHVVVLAIFRRRPSRLDVVAIGTAIAVAVATLLK